MTTETLEMVFWELEPDRLHSAWAEVRISKAHWRASAAKTVCGVDIPERKVATTRYKNADGTCSRCEKRTGRTPPRSR